jgi:hypothetical protein
MMQLVQSGDDSIGKGLVPLFAGINGASQQQQQQQQSSNFTSSLHSAVKVLPVSTVYTAATATLHISVTAAANKASTAAAADTDNTNSGVVLTGLTVVSATDTLRYAQVVYLTLLNM